MDTVAILAGANAAAVVPTGTPKRESRAQAIVAADDGIEVLQSVYHNYRLR